MQVWRKTSTSIRSGVNIMSLLMLVQTSDYCMLLDVSHWSSQEGPWMPSTMWCMQVVCFSTSWWPASIAVVDARCTCHTPGGPTDESHWPLGDPSTAHHLRSVVSLPMLPSFKVLCILLSVCLWRSHRPRSCTLGGPIACVLSTPGGPTAMITCLNIDDTTTLAPIPAVGPLHTMLCQSSLMHDLCSNCSHLAVIDCTAPSDIIDAVSGIIDCTAPSATPCSHGGLLPRGRDPQEPADRHDSSPP